MQNAALPRICLVLESEEESGSDNLIDLLKLSEEYIGKPDCLFCLDSGCLDYEQLWITSSLRGVAMVDLKVECGTSGYHSGEVGGIVPETFRIVRALLDRIDDPKTGKVVEEFQSALPDWKVKEAHEVVASQQKQLYEKFPLQEGVQVMNQDNLAEMYLDNVWRPNLSITGGGGLPDFKKAGNVIRAQTTVRCSLRISPVMDSEEAKEKLVSILTTDVPYDAKVTILGSNGGDGFCMKVL